MDYIFSIHGVCRLKYLIGYRFFRHGNLSVRKHAMQFFYAKTYRFPRGFPHISRRGGNLPPVGMRSIFLYFSAFTRNIITYYPLPITSKKAPANRLYQSTEVQKNNNIKMIIRKLPPRRLTDNSQRLTAQAATPRADS